MKNNKPIEIKKMPVDDWSITLDRNGIDFVNADLDNLPEGVDIYYQGLNETTLHITMKVP